ncbi:MAG: electron transport complex subunit RsxC [Lentisphaerae bacterium]|nr:electron transport complex subunit RsxC [Lentisphaerota bacterium]
MTNTLKVKFRSPGGVHPEYRKELVADKPAREMPLPQLLSVSMSQHLGAPALPLVKKGDTVLRGQPIGEPAGFISASVHAPTSGTVKAVTRVPTASGQLADAVDIEPDGEDRWDPAIEEKTTERAERLRDFEADPTAHASRIVEAVADAGVAGMGGAGFPTHVKLSPPPGKSIDTLIVNGAECEPYLAADNRLMIEQADRIRAGANIIRRALGATVVRVAIEDNKPDAIDAMRRAMANADGDAAVSVLPTEYPHGAEKQQIYVITGREVPSGGLPMDVGALVENVGTCVATWDAVVNGHPLTQRITTVTGDPVSEPSNVLVRIGTRYSDLLDYCGGLSGPADKIISGGPMMGLAQASLDVAVSKTTSGLLALSPDHVGEFTSMPCISCGRCVDACPIRLMPAELSQMLEAEDYEAAAGYGVADCIECGCCAFVCPAHRPLVQHARRGKAWVAAQRRKK